MRRRHIGSSRREPGRLEQELLALVAAASGPVTPAQAQAELGGDLAYTTVMTTLSRLHAKGALAREPAGRGYAYRLAADPDTLPAALTGRRMSRMLAEEKDRAATLARFVDDLDPGDEALLTALLARREPPTTTGGTSSGPETDRRPSR